MKKSVVSFAVVVVALLATLSAAQTASSPVVKNAGAQARDIARGDVTWARSETGELAQVRAQLEVLPSRQGVNLPNAAELRKQIEVLEKQAPWVLSFDFPGGSITKFLAIISKASVVSFNIVNAGDPGDLATELPPFSLRNANLGTVIGVVGKLLYPRGFDLKHVGRESPNPGEANSVVCVLTKHPGAQVVAPTPPALFDSFYLKPHLATQSIDDVVDAIRTGWEMNPSHQRDALRLKYHPATFILLVSGPPEAMMVVSKIISQVMKAPDVDPKPAQRKIPPEAVKR